MRVLCIRHGDGPEDDRVTSWCRLNGIDADTRRPFKGDAAGQMTPDLAEVVVHGGMYDADATEAHPFLREEYRLIDAALAAGTPILGICQGAQMLARALGAWTGGPEHGRHEFGYCEVTPTEAGTDFLPETLHMCQAHYHSYDLPEGAEHLARSALFEQQAFRWGDAAYGIQFHAENTIEGFRRWQAQPASAGQPGAQPPEEQERLMHAHDRAQAEWFYGFLDRFIPREPRT
jgi:GMP synthase (glutamine-hydrolysing)